METALYDDIKKRLESLGYAAGDPDEWAIGFIADKVSGEIKNACNVSGVPDGLHHAVIDMICGEFLNMKKGTGQLDGFDVEAAVKSISEGDTSVTYAVADNSITLDGLIFQLINCGRSQFATFRRISW